MNKNSRIMSNKLNFINVFNIYCQDQPHIYSISTQIKAEVIFIQQIQPLTQPPAQNSSERRLKYQFQFQLKQRLRLALFSNKSSHPPTEPPRHPSRLEVKWDLSGSIHKRLFADCINTNFARCFDNFKTNSEILQESFRTTPDFF